MLPDIRFAIGAVLAGAVLIVTAFGLAATVRVAHHTTVGLLETPPILAYAEDRDGRPYLMRRTEESRTDAGGAGERVAALPAAPEAATEPEPPQAAAPPEQEKTAAAKSPKKKAAKARKHRKHRIVRQPTANTGYWVDGSPLAPD